MPIPQDQATATAEERHDIAKKMNPSIQRRSMVRQVNIFVESHERFPEILDWPQSKHADSPESERRGDCNANQ